MSYFAHEDMPVYRSALDLVGLMGRVIARIPAPFRSAGNQLLRAVISVPLNIGEGVAEYRNGEKQRFYRIARRSAAEVACVLDALLRLGVVDPELHRRGKELASEIAASLLRLIYTVRDRPEPRKSRATRQTAPRRPASGQRPREQARDLDPKPKPKPKPNPEPTPIDADPPGFPGR